MSLVSLLPRRRRRRRKRRPQNQNQRQSQRKMRAQPRRRRRRRRRPPSKAFIHINAPVITRIPQNHLSPRGGRFGLLVSTKKIHFQKNYRSVPERWINIFCIDRMSVFPLPSVWTSGAPLCCTRRRNV